LGIAKLFVDQAVRGLNFWLPMLPGMWFAREVMRARGSFAHKKDIASHAAWVNCIPVQYPALYI
jgi:hypothetical protein